MGFGSSSQLPRGGRGMVHTVIEDDAGLQDVRRTWSALLAANPRPLLPLTWEWLSTWWTCFRGGDRLSRDLRLFVHLFENERGPRAIVPMVRMEHRFRGVWMRAVGSMANGHSLLWDAILHPDLQPEELDDMGTALLGTPGVELWLFRQLAGDSRLLDWLSHRAESPGRFGVLHTVRSPLVPTRGSWDAYLDQRPRLYRKSVRKKVRVFDDHPGTSVERVPLLSATDPVLEEVTEVSRRSWKAGVAHDLGSDRAGREFLGRLVDPIGPGGEAEVWLARLDGRAIAYELHFRKAGITYPIRADFDEAFRHLAPGSVLEYRAVEAAFADPAIHVYDTCAADYWYLRQLTDRSREIHDAAVFSRGVRGTALYALEFGLMPVLRRIRKWVRPRRQGS